MSEMAKKYDHREVEPRIANLWESKGVFIGKVDPSKKPYTIVLPPPNANGALHVGHALMIAIEDLLIRWKKMKGYSTLWVPGLDHAGFETQVVYERSLAKQGKSRLDFDRQTLYNDIATFVEKEKNKIRSQIKALGPSLDWSRERYTLDKSVIETVYATFKKLASENLIYRDNYMVNYSPHHGTTFSDLEIEYKENKASLFYVRYMIIDKSDNEPEYVVVATTRPETIFVDTHLAVNPKDEKNKWLIGRLLKNPLTDIQMNVLGDPFVDPEFGTGIVKLTPGHDRNDFEVARKNNLPIISILDLNGKLNEEAGKYEVTKSLVGLSSVEAREKVVTILEQKNLIEKINDKYTNTIAVDYKDQEVIEPMVFPNWFVKVGPLKEPALNAVNEGKVNIYPKWREITYTKWMEEMRDWPISRQIVWGIRIPVWYNVDINPNIRVSFLSQSGKVEFGEISSLLKTFSFEEISKGLQSLYAPKDATYEISSVIPGERFLQETDTFDTWFSSGHWPLVTLNYPDSEDFKYFYPTNVLETGWEIIRFWVSRMIMFGIYLTGKPPFSDVYLHGLVFAEDGRKMSKSLGNQVDPLLIIDEYGADALRVGLIAGTANGKDFAFPKDKVIAYRNFANKIWNMARFLGMMKTSFGKEIPDYSEDMKNLHKMDLDILAKLKATNELVDNSLEKYRFFDAIEAIYQFMWKELADVYLENIKAREDKEIALSVFTYVFNQSLRLLHPFMPFVTEEISQYTAKNNGLLLE